MYLYNFDAILHFILVQAALDRKQSKDALIPQLYFRSSKPGTGHFDSETLDVNEIRETDTLPPFIEAIRRKLRDKRTISNKQKV